MYDHTEAARRRILLASADGGTLGRMYRDLANILNTAPNSPQKLTAMKKLADSCESAMALVEKTRQSKRNPPANRRPPGETNG
ncbi:hypothetical protein SEA_SATIS_25 [Streptomyces phage Satis]|nr:hypothetical protein SEA_SATIS_25 [Streptomyces phage Satis]QBZ71924.1 hypothetical protein SEA_KRADAL_25 [Streptomyces phage Kradal]QPL14342.1 hypothetical protein SEA_EHYELIMAYOE_25 [Streptomyces phage EhyElimayoE]